MLISQFFVAFFASHTFLYIYFCELLLVRHDDNDAPAIVDNNVENVALAAAAANKFNKTQFSATHTLTFALNTYMYSYN